jgi:hypothetical protein
MATTTPSFGWPVPTSTDLVKDGATAIESLGDAIDASLTDLKGGTTGQVLSKASGTDMDFTWVAQDDSNAIQNAIIDAKGDLIAGASADTPARLAVGTNGQVLTANSSATNGLEWATPATPSAGLTLITSASLSGSSVSVNNCFSSTYSNYLIITVGMLGSTGGDDLFLNLRASGTDANSNYNRFIWGSSNYETSTGQSNLRVGLINSTQAFVRCVVTNPFASAATGFDFAANRSSSSAWVGIGYHSTASSYDGFTLAPTGGTFSAGTVYVYGYAK